MPLNVMVLCDEIRPGRRRPSHALVSHLAGDTELSWFGMGLRATPSPHKVWMHDVTTTWPAEVPPFNMIVSEFCYTEVYASRLYWLEILRHLVPGGLLVTPAIVATDRLDLPGPNGSVQVHGDIIPVYLLMEFGLKLERIIHMRPHARPTPDNERMWVFSKS